MDGDEHERGGKPEAKADGKLRPEENRRADRQATRCAEKMRKRHQGSNPARRSEGPERRKRDTDGEGERMPAPPYRAGDSAAGDEQSGLQQPTA